VVKVRSIIASLLAVLLLCGASWGYACGLACQSPQAKMCAQAAMAHASMAMDCDHCPGHAGHTVSASMACGTMMTCGDTALLHARADVDEDASHLLASPHWVVTSLTLVLPASVVAVDDRRSDPPRDISAFHPLLVSLRV
jgi:hypothetical protein